MNCPVCGTQVADGTAICPVCGASLAVASENIAQQPFGGDVPPQPDFNQGAQEPGFNQGADQQFGGYNPGPQPAPEAPKSKTGLIIGIAAAAIVIIGLILCFALGVFSGKNGKYVCKDFALFGIDMSLTVDGSNCTLDMSYGEGEDMETDSESGTISFSGDKVECVFVDETLSGTYNKKDKSIILDIEGMEFTFAKE